MSVADQHGAAVPLTDKAAVVTGGGQGMGRGLALAFAAAGAQVAVADISAESARKVASEIEAAGGAAIAVEVDVSSASQVAAMTDTALAAFGHVDILLNNAGVRHLGEFLDHTEEDWLRTLNVDLTGCFLCMRSVVPVMMEHGAGSIVNTASIAGLVGRPGRVAYCTAKFGVVGLTMSSAFDLGKYGIRVNALAPGLINTPMNAEYALDPQRAKLGADETALRRWGESSDIASAAIFLASDASAYITGVTLPVDGGWLAARKRAYE